MGVIEWLKKPASALHPKQSSLQRLSSKQILLFTHFSHPRDTLWQRQSGGIGRRLRSHGLMFFTTETRGSIYHAALAKLLCCSDVHFKAWCIADCMELASRPLKHSARRGELESGVLWKYTEDRFKGDTGYQTLKHCQIQRDAGRQMIEERDWVPFYSLAACVVNQ